MSDFLLIFLAFVMVVVLVPCAAWVARRVGLVDKPDARKQHEGVVPLVGGVVIFPIFFLFSFFMNFDFFKNWTFHVGLIFLLVVGAIDDRFHINPWLRFFVQIFVACLVVFEAGLRLDHLGPLFGEENFELGLMAVPFAIAAVVLLINAINLMDGLDGLAGGQSAVILFWLIAASLVSGQVQPALQMSILLAAVCGFLVYNMRRPGRSKAAVFMGDAGSLSFGFALAWFSISLAKEPYLVLPPICVAWILAVPIMDECAQFYRRVREGRHPFSPDRGHFHHHFIAAGFSPGQATVLILLLSFTMGGLAYVFVLYEGPQIVLTSGWICLLLAHMVISEKPERYVRWLAGIRQMRSWIGVRE